MRKSWNRSGARWSALAVMVLAAVGACRDAAVTAPAPVTPTEARALRAPLPTGVAKVVVGDRYTCTLRAAGTISCLGDNSKQQAPSLLTAPTGMTYIDIAAADSYTCSLRSDGLIECFGENETVTPLVGSGKSAATGSFTQVGVSRNGLCGLRTDGVVQCWGVNFNVAPATKTASSGTYTQLRVHESGACVLTTNATVDCWGDTNVSIRADGRAASSGTFTKLAVGSGHACALRSDGVIECWGSNSDGQAPATVTAGGSSTFIDVMAGVFATCGLRADKVMQCWGDNGFNQAPATRTPDNGGQYAQVSIGYQHGCAVRTDSATECWGDDVFGAAPVVRTASVGRYTQVSAGGAHSCGVRTDGAMECWGGLPAGIEPVMTPITSSFVQAAGSLLYACAVRTDGVAQCWGDNSEGQAPAAKSGVSGGFTQIAVGAGHSCALTSVGVVECWGRNAALQAPASRSALTGTFTKITAHGNSTCGLRSDGKVECWGARGWGPYLWAPEVWTPSSGGSFTDVNFGDFYLCARRSDGAVECLGNATLATIFHSPTETRSSIDAVGFTQVDGAQLFTCALRADAAVECWGKQAPLPAVRRAQNGRSFVALSVNSMHACALRDDGGVECWPNGGAYEAPRLTPSATFSAPASVAAGSPIALSFSNAQIAAVPGYSTFYYAFDCGTGDGYGALSTTASASCPTTQAGTRTVRGIVRDRDGEQQVYSASVTITDTPPPPAVPTTLQFTSGAYFTTSAVTLSVQLSAPTTCIAGRTITFREDADGNGSYETILGAALTDAAGVASVTVNNVALGTLHDVQATVGVATGCDVATTTAPFVVAGSGDAANGAGNYVVQGAGRVGVGVVAQRKVTKTVTTVSGTMSVQIAGKVRFKGTVTAYTQIVCPTQTPSLTGAKCGVLLGTASRFTWNATTATWVLAETGVPLELMVADGGVVSSGGKNGTSTARADFARFLVSGRTVDGATSTLYELKSGNILLK